MARRTAKQTRRTPDANAPRRVALYARVSTRGQTVENQLMELRAWAERAGHEIVGTYKDEGVSGTKGRDERPALDAALKDATRRRFDLLAVWSVDRLGRSLPDLIDAMKELHGAGVDLFIHQQALDTTTPTGKAMFGMLGIFGEFEAAIIKERVNAGLDRARAQGTKLGRPVEHAGDVEAQVRELLAQGVGMIKIGKTLGIGTSPVQRIAKAMKQQEEEAAAA